MKKIFNISLVTVCDIYNGWQRCPFHIVEKKILPTYLKLLTEISYKFTLLGFIDANTFLH